MRNGNRVDRGIQEQNAGRNRRRGQQLAQAAQPGEVLLAPAENSTSTYWQYVCRKWSTASTPMKFAMVIGGLAALGCSAYFIKIYTPLFVTTLDNTGKSGETYKKVFDHTHLSKAAKQLYKKNNFDIEKDKQQIAETVVALAASSKEQKCNIDRIHRSEPPLRIEINTSNEMSEDYIKENGQRAAAPILGTYDDKDNTLRLNSGLFHKEGGFKEAKDPLNRQFQTLPYILDHELDHYRVSQENQESGLVFTNPQDGSTSRTMDAPCLPGPLGLDCAEIVGIYEYYKTLSTRLVTSLEKSDDQLSATEKKLLTQFKDAAAQDGISPTKSYVQLRQLIVNMDTKLQAYSGAYFYMDFDIYARSIFDKFPHTQRLFFPTHKEFHLKRSGEEYRRCMLTP